MVQAIKLIKSGKSPSIAARKVGLAVQSIYRSPLYKALKAEAK